MRKIGIEAAYYDREDGTTDFAAMAEDGYQCADYSKLCDITGVRYHCSDEELRDMLTRERDEAAACGITFSQVHGPWYVDDTSAEKRAHNLACMKRSVVGTAHLNGKYVVIHPVMPYAWDKEADPAFAVKTNEDYFREILEFAMDYPVGICIENMPTFNHTLADIPSLIDFVDRMNMPNFSICLDTGHCNYTHQDPGEMVRLCGQRLTVLHVHDNAGGSDQHLIPYGWGGGIHRGGVNWDSFRTALNDIGFDGCLSMETGIQRECPEYLRRILLKGEAAIANYLASNEI